jgi:hypothetical protein
MTRTRIETRWVGMGMGLGALGCGPGGVDSLEGFGDAGLDVGDDDEGDDDEGDDAYAGPFTLQAAALDDSDTIVLTFTHPLGSLEDVDPLDFRISFVISSQYVKYYGSGYYESTIYRDPNYWGYSYTPFRMAVFAAGDNEDQLRLEFDVPLGDESCYYIQSWGMPSPPNQRILGLFVHHRAGAIPLRDGQGTPLADFGADWVETESFSMYIPGFGMPELDPRIEIPCP